MIQHRFPRLWTGRFHILVILFGVMLMLHSCIRYSFTGASIPSDVETIYIAFFPDQSQSGLGDLSARLNEALTDRFINQSRLTLTSDRETADAILEGSIQRYQNRPFSISGDQQASLNEIQIMVQAQFRYREDPDPVYSKTFTGNATFNVRENPVDGENEAATLALEQIANNAFNDAVSNW